MTRILPPPLALYVHLPWCVRKCPYCDFNSHTLRGDLVEDRYIDALLRDLETDVPLIDGRRVETVFFGGGTPSLFSPESIARLLHGIRARVTVANDAEITLEANPGTIELERFRGFRTAGINRLSIGIQSFNDTKLQALGRIHDRREAETAADAARAAGFDNFNLDLMYGLPEQTVEQALADCRTAVALAPTHLSVYQLTLEPNTLFHQHPPALPDEETIDAMHDGVIEILANQGYAQYEVSAYAQQGRQCRHNRNYWEFGDYLGIGAGAHGKISTAREVSRVVKARHPETYLRDAGTPLVRSSVRTVTVQELPFEFMMNALRLRNGVPPALFHQRTGIHLDQIQEPLTSARRRGLLESVTDAIRPTPLGWRFLNDLIALFLPKKDQ